MRYILNIKLSKSKYIGVIGNAPTSQELKEQAIAISPRLFQDKQLHIIPSSKITQSDEWEQERITNIDKGNKLYQVAFMLDGTVQCITIKASSYKSAYNNTKLTYGISDNIFMMIYELTQGITRTSSLSKSSEILRDKDKFSELLKNTIEKLKGIDDLDRHKQQISVILHVLKDTFNGKYNGLNYNDMVYAVAYIVYFNDSLKYIPDMVRNNTEITENDAIIILLQNSANIIDKYMDWRKNNAKQ